MSISIKNIEDRIQEAVGLYHQSTKPNIAKLARDFGRLRGFMAASLIPTVLKQLQYRSLNLIQEKALTS